MQEINEWITLILGAVLGFLGIVGVIVSAGCLATWWLIALLAGVFAIASGLGFGMVLVYILGGAIGAVLGGLLGLGLSALSGALAGALLT